MTTADVLTHAPRPGRAAARAAALAAGAGLLLAVPGAAWAAPTPPPAGSRPSGPPPHVHPVRVTSALPVRTEPTSPAVTWTSLPGSTSLTV